MDPQDDFPSLLSIVQDAIKHKYINFLGDIGSLEVNLLESILKKCSPDQLINIEDSTLHGVCKRDLTGYTWPLWYNHCINNDFRDFFASLKTYPPLPPPSNGSYRGEPLSLSLPNNIAPAHYRRCYEQIVKHREDKLTQVGKRLKEMREMQEKEKASRTIQVIARPLPPVRKRGAAAFGRNNQPSKQQHPPVKERIMKKLNVSSPDLKSNSKRTMLSSNSYKKHSSSSGGGGGSGGKKPGLTAAALAGRVKVKNPQELAREEAERKLAKLKAASVLNDDDIFGKRRAAEQAEHAWDLNFPRSLSPGKAGGDF